MYFLDVTQVYDNIHEEDPWVCFEQWQASRRAKRIRTLPSDNPVQGNYLQELRKIVLNKEAYNVDSSLSEVLQQKGELLL